MHVTVIGLGLIGGSWSLALKEKFSDITLTGYDLERKHRDKALTLGLIDKVAESLEESIQGSEWIFLCTPVDALVQIGPKLLDQVLPHQIVVDFGSTKKVITLHLRITLCRFVLLPTLDTFGLPPIVGILIGVN